MLQRDETMFDKNAVSLKYFRCFAAALIQDHFDNGTTLSHAIC